MRDPKRIDRILKKLGEAWKKNPDVRLCQLLLIIAASECGWSRSTLFYLEDNELEKGIEKTLELK